MHVTETKGPQPWWQRPDEPPSVTFGRTVRERRQALNLTQRELAERLTELGWPTYQAQIAKVEAGTRPTSVDEVAMLAYALEERPGVSSFVGLPASRPAVSRQRVRHSKRERQS